MGGVRVFQHAHPYVGFIAFAPYTLEVALEHIAVGLLIHRTRFVHPIIEPMVYQPPFFGILDLLTNSALFEALVRKARGSICNS